MPDQDPAPRIEELLERRAEPLPTEPEIAADWARQRRVHLLLCAHLDSGDADTTYAAITAARSQSRRERIARGIDRRMRPGRRAKPARWRWITAGLLAAGLLAAAMFTHALMAAAPADLGTWDDGTTAALVVRPGTWVEATGRTGALHFHDGTVISCAPGCRLRILAGQQADGRGPAKRLELASGRLDAVVSHQPTDQPMILITPQAQATVVGTTFSLAVDGTATRLEVSEGKVSLANADGAVGLVESGYFAVAAPGVALTPTKSELRSVTVVGGRPVPATRPVSGGPSGPGWVMAFHDEFDGDAIDLAKWAITKPYHSWGVGWYSPDAVKVGKGVAQLSAWPTKGPKGEPYASGVLISYNSGGSAPTGPGFKQRYGWWETRMKMPPQGGWCSFWLFAPQWDRSEIDIAGWPFGDRHRVVANMYNPDGVSHEHWSQTDFDVTEDFHIYACDWEPDHIVYYIDGVECGRTTEKTPAKEMLMIFHYACGGWGGFPKAPFPATWAIDYCRVYRRDGTMSDPPAITAITAEPVLPAIQEPIAFTAAVTTGQDAANTYAWSFGDGATGQGASPTHAYATPGRYTVTLLVSDAAGRTANRMLDIAVAGAR